MITGAISMAFFRSLTMEATPRETEATEAKVDENNTRSAYKPDEAVSGDNETFYKQWGPSEEELKAERRLNRYKRYFRYQSSDSSSDSDSESGLKNSTMFRQWVADTPKEFDEMYGMHSDDDSLSDDSEHSYKR